MKPRDILQGVGLSQHQFTNGYAAPDLSLNNFYTHYRKKQPIKWSEVAETDESHISTKESVAYVKTAPQQGEGAFDYEMPMTQCAAYETRPTDPLYDFVNQYSIDCAMNFPHNTMA